jgi:hypothetical protein
MSSETSLWGASGPFPPAKTLILARGMGTRTAVPTAQHMVAALQWADGVHFPVVLLNDGAAIMRPFGDRWGRDLRLAGEPLSNLTSQEVAERNHGPAPMLLPRVLLKLRGKPKNCELVDVLAAGDLIPTLDRSGTEPNELVVTSLRTPGPELVRAHRFDGPHLKAGLLLYPWNPVRGTVGDAFPRRLLERTGSDCAAVHWSLYLSGVLHRSGGRPGIVVADDPYVLGRCFRDESVPAVITYEPELAYHVREQLI